MKKVENYEIDFGHHLYLYSTLVKRLCQLYSVKQENSLSIMQEDNKKGYFFSVSQFIDDSVMSSSNVTLF